MAGLSIRIDLAQQALQVLEGDTVVTAYRVSTARNGAGEQRDSECTPRGRHQVRAKIGAGLESGAVLVGRRPTGEICTAAKFHAQPDRDWILTRILWLSGLERGKNRLGDVDTMRRHIYIHGCPDQVPVGKPGSHGCIRMRNRDVIKLFDDIDVGTEVLIVEGSSA